VPEQHLVPPHAARRRPNAQDPASLRSEAQRSIAETQAGPRSGPGNGRGPSAATQQNHQPCRTEARPRPIARPRSGSDPRQRQASDEAASRAVIETLGPAGASQTPVPPPESSGKEAELDRALSKSLSPARSRRTSDPPPKSSGKVAEWSIIARRSGMPGKEEFLYFTNSLSYSFFIFLILFIFLYIF
jgi:hypothetical protein